MNCMFQHHPDGIITIKNDNQIYIDTLENFILDYGKEYFLPDDQILRFYIRGKEHYVSDGHNQIMLETTWDEGNQIISFLPNLLLSQQNRIKSLEHIPTIEEIMEQIRSTRNRLLAKCDWTQLPDAPLTVEQKHALAIYRQQLRDFPSTCDPKNPAWPIKPNS